MKFLLTAMCALCAMLACGGCCGESSNPGKPSKVVPSQETVTSERPRVADMVRAESDLRQLVDNVLAYKLRKGKNPESLSDLKELEGSESFPLVDPWGRPYLMNRMDAGMVIWTNGFNLTNRMDDVEKRLTLGDDR